MNGQNAFDGLEFDEQLVLHNTIDAIATVEIDALCMQLATASARQISGRGERTHAQDNLHKPIPTDQGQATCGPRSRNRSLSP